jgi:fermentation-respiration switch protein FrsA (DUF1100 family)
MPACRGRRADHAQKDRVGTWEVPRSARAIPLLVRIGDDRTAIAEAKAMFDRAAEPKQFWAVDGAGHVDLEHYAPEEYRQRILPFLVEWLRPDGRGFQKM